MLMLPELIIIITAFILCFTDLFITESRGEHQRVVLAPLAMLGILTAIIYSLFYLPYSGEILGGRFALDSVTWWFKIFFLLTALITVTLSLDIFDGRTNVSATGFEHRGEYYTILLFNIAGMMFLASSRDLISLYVSLELATIPLFLVTAWRKDSISGEAGLKYVIIGAIASALLLYGLGIIYGLTGQTQLVTIGQLLKPSPALWLAAALVTAGIGFKLTIVPFHMWAADIYQGAPTPITAYLSVASKCAGLVLMFQLFFRTFGHFVGSWIWFLAVFAAITMTLGNLAAIVQQNIKRFMAFSAISQAGYLIMGFLNPSREGVSAMIFYMLIYIVTNLAVFAVIIFYSNQTGREEIKDYRGLSRTNPLIALAMMIALFGLAGIPPLSGFVGKFFLFSIAAKAGFNWLVAVAAINSTVSLYYYLRIVRQMYIEPLSEDCRKLTITPVLGSTLCITVIASVLIGIVPFFYNAVRISTAGWLEPLIR